MQNNRILVTGGAGYIGSHTCKLLHSHGYVPIVYDNLSSGNSWAVKWGPLVLGDILDTPSLVNTIREHKPSAVIHFAAKAYVDESFKKTIEYYQTNVGGTISLLQACQITGIKNLVFSSSCAVYGTPDSTPILESDKINPISPYGKTKAFAEEVIQDFAFNRDFNATILRYFNAAGSDPDCEIGECHIPETHLIPNVLRAAIGREKKVVINGVNHRTPDGTCIRDYVHVTDLARAHFLAVVQGFSNREIAKINLGRGTGASIKEVIDITQHITGHNVPVIENDPREGDPPIVFADNTLAKRYLSWEPQYTLREIIYHAFLWEKKLY